jgi:hypothetical protein
MRLLLPLSKVITRDIMASIKWLGMRNLAVGEWSRHHLRNREVDPFSGSACGNTPPRRPMAAT